MIENKEPDIMNMDIIVGGEEVVDGEVIEDEPAFVEEEEKQKEKDKQISERNKKLFLQLVHSYYQSAPYQLTIHEVKEMNIQFSPVNYKTPFTRNDYENVIRSLKSNGFTSKDEQGEYRLFIQTELPGKYSGLSNQQITGIEPIRVYCKTESIRDVIHASVESVKFTRTYTPKTNKGDALHPVNFADYRFKVIYQIEEIGNASNMKYKDIIEGWDKMKKAFRYENCVTFTHPDYPILFCLSIVKVSPQVEDIHPKTGKKYKKNVMVGSLKDTKIFTNAAMNLYEIEIRVDNSRIGPSTKFNKADTILDSLKKAVKIVLSGLQGTNYPVSYNEQYYVLQSYKKILFPDEDAKVPYNAPFIGPSSDTLQLINITDSDTNSVPNIRQNYTVTEKADGERHLLFIHPTNGKIYLVNRNMKVIFTGAKTETKQCFGSILDGELVRHNKSGEFINLYAAFDLYFLHGKNVRVFPFINRKYSEREGEGEEGGMEEEEKKGEIVGSRYSYLKVVVENLRAKNIVKNNSLEVSPIRIEYKHFSESWEESIFEACNRILSKESQDMFEYNTDGLILTPTLLGVNSSKEGVAGPLKNDIWFHSFKWKPSNYNTVDFLVYTVKSKENGRDVVKTFFENGVEVNSVSQIKEYKTIQLMCGYSEKQHGYINPCQDIIDDKLPEFSASTSYNDLKPMQFIPMDPYDINAGLCNIMLKEDASGEKQMTTEEDMEVFNDYTIVEFRYDMNREPGWRWIPLRVRHDKTAQLLQGRAVYGNSYNIANSNWKSIHYEVTQEMITTGKNIPTNVETAEVYYNRKSERKVNTKALRNFHKLYVKKNLIVRTSSPGDILIDYACGKAGDLPDWIDAKLSFVFGIDLYKDNIETRIDSACARYLRSVKTIKEVPGALFLAGDTAYNIRDGHAYSDEKSRQISNAVFGVGTNNPEKIGKGVAKYYGKGEEGFNISSCQFALHYFFKDMEILKGFMRNISECTRVGGYFVGTTYDGSEVFNLLKKKKEGESVQIVENGEKVWEIVKGYKNSEFGDNSTSLGYRIDVYQETINQLIPEYLVNFDYLNRVMENYGFQILTDREAEQIGFHHGSGSFRELFDEMLHDIKTGKGNKSDYGIASDMTEYEKQISFLNRYFIYKKVRKVNTNSVILDEEREEEEEEMIIVPKRVPKREAKKKEEKKEQEEKKEKEEKEEKPKKKIRTLKKKLVLNTSPE